MRFSIQTKLVNNNPDNSPHSTLLSPNALIDFILAISSLHPHQAEKLNDNHKRDRPLAVLSTQLQTIL